MNFRHTIFWRTHPVLVVQQCLSRLHLGLGVRWAGSPLKGFFILFLSTINLLLPENDPIPNHENHSKSNGNAILHLVWEKCHVPGTRIHVQENRRLKSREKNSVCRCGAVLSQLCSWMCSLFYRTKLKLQINSR